jgi:iron complex transport system ATP-binding protein
VTVRYPGRAQDALHEVTFEAMPGRITAVVGPNGSGKSTLVRTLLQRVPTKGGQITIDQEPLDRLSPRLRAQRIAIVPQRDEAVLPMRVSDFVLLGRYPHRGAFGAPGIHDEQAVARAVAQTGMTAATERRTDMLSGGEWQRVRIARALAQEAPVLVLDEPTTFLDIAHEMAVFELLDALARDGRTILLVSHQLNLVARFAEQIVLLDRGRIAAMGTPEIVMRGDILEAVYDWPLVVTRDPAVGAPALLPLRGRIR